MGKRYNRDKKGSVKTFAFGNTSELPFENFFKENLKEQVMNSKGNEKKCAIKYIARPPTSRKLVETKLPVIGC